MLVFHGEFVQGSQIKRAGVAIFSIHTRWLYKRVCINTFPALTVCPAFSCISNKQVRDQPYIVLFALGCWSIRCVSFIDDHSDSLVFFFFFFFYFIHARARACIINTVSIAEYNELFLIFRYVIFGNRLSENKITIFRVNIREPFIREKSRIKKDTSFDRASQSHMCLL